MIGYKDLLMAGLELKLFGELTFYKVKKLHNLLTHSDSSIHERLRVLIDNKICYDSERLQIMEEIIFYQVDPKERDILRNAILKKYNELFNFRRLRDTFYGIETKNHFYL